MSKGSGRTVPTGLMLNPMTRELLPMRRFLAAAGGRSMAR